MIQKNFVVFLVVEICRHNKTYFLTVLLAWKKAVFYKVYNLQE
jgi:hypothetical protein